MGRRKGRPKKTSTPDDIFKHNIADDILDSLHMTSLTAEQIKALRNALDDTFRSYKIEKKQEIQDDERSIIDINTEALEEFLQSKRVTGKSANTIYNYGNEISKMFRIINKDYRFITSQDIRDFMDFRRDHDKVSMTTVANIRMYLLSFFKWAEIEEKLSGKNPMNKIGVVKKEKKVIDTLTDEESEMIRCACDNERDLAIVDMLAGSGMRVSELTHLNRTDVNFNTGEIKVYGKGNKERICYLTGRAKVHLKWYLESRTDNKEALFVSAKKPYTRLSKTGIEHILKQVAKKTGIDRLRLYPHKYRSTLATNMINKGADISTISQILGHANIDVTASHYAAISNNTLHQEHKKYTS